MAYFILAVLALAAGGVIGFYSGRFDVLHNLLNGKTVTFSGETYAVREVRRNQESTGDPMEGVDEFIRQKVEEHNAAVNAAPHRETFRERVAREYPEALNPKCDGGVVFCPDHYGYEPRGTCLYKGDPRDGEIVCRECWDREIPGEAENNG